MRAILIALILILCAGLLGWWSYSNNGGDATITINKDKAAQDTKEAVEDTKDAFRDAGESIDNAIDGDDESPN
jgi:hypothetical protein